MKRFNAAFVSPHPRPWWSRLFNGLFGRRKAERGRRPPTQIVPIYHGMPPHVGDFHRRASDAIALLRLMVEGKPATRRAWLALGRSDRRWRQARKVIKNAKVMNQDGELMYSGRDALLRLDVYLDGIEDKCRTSGRYVSP